MSPWPTILFRSDGPTIFEGNEGTGWTWEGNIAFGGSLGPKNGAAGITVVDPQLQLDSDGLWRLSSNSPADRLRVPAVIAVIISDDMDGQARIGLFDIGADEFSMAQIVRKPLAAGDVGPSWLAARSIPPVAMGAALPVAVRSRQKTYAAILDPNNNGLYGPRLPIPDALGGEAMRAPLGAHRQSSRRHTGHDRRLRRDFRTARDLSGLLS